LQEIFRGQGPGGLNDHSWAKGGTAGRMLPKWSDLILTEKSPLDGIALLSRADVAVDMPPVDERPRTCGKGCCGLIDSGRGCRRCREKSPARLELGGKDLHITERTARNAPCKLGAQMQRLHLLGMIRRKVTEGKFQAGPRGDQHALRIALPIKKSRRKR
jgi:hypothetical protein